MPIKDPTFSIGIEEEYLLVERASRDLVREMPQALFDAAQQARSLRNEFSRSVKRNEEFASARQTMDNLNVAYLGANAYYGGAVRARNIALTYAYHLHRYDDYQYRVGYYPYYYGGGYGYPTNYYKSGRYYGHYR